MILAVVCDDGRCTSVLVADPSAATAKAVVFDQTDVPDKGNSPAQRVPCTGSSSLFRSSWKVSAKWRAASYGGSLWMAAHRSKALPWARQSAWKHWKMCLPKWAEKVDLLSLD